jgi:hypothetical protein
VCGYLLVRSSVHAHAYALALKKITGVEIEKICRGGWSPGHGALPVSALEKSAATPVLSAVSIGCLNWCCGPERRLTLPL